jgi:hypothetical protein
LAFCGSLGFEKIIVKWGCSQILGWGEGFQYPNNLHGTLAWSMARRRTRNTDKMPNMVPNAMYGHIALRLKAPTVKTSQPAKLTKVTKILHMPEQHLLVM